MNNIEIRFDENDEIVYRYIPAPEYGKGVCKIEPIIDKKTFIKCYEKWIKSDEKKKPIPPID